MFRSIVTFAACPTPQYPYQQTPTHQSIALSWSYNGSGTPNYQVHWRSAGTVSWNLSPALTSAQHSLTGLSNNTAYEWRVRAICAEGDTSAFTNPLLFQTRCEGPTYLNTSDVTHQSARLTWYTSVSGGTYEVQWRPAGTTDWIGISGITITYVNLTGLANNVTYEWQVRTRCSATATSDFTSSTLFQTLCAVPGIPVTARVTTDAAELRWESAGANARYDLQWRAAGTANWTVVSDLNAPEHILTGLQTNTTYEWQVRGQCANGSAFETTASFTTADDCAGKLYTLRDGSWDDPAVWSCGRIPAAGDPVQLRHTLTMPTGYTARAQAVQYSSGAKLQFEAGARLRLGE